MTGKLNCLICGTGHKATNKKFPVISQKKLKNKEGQMEDKIVGYICMKCCRKAIKRQEQEKRMSITRK